MIIGKFKNAEEYQETCAILCKQYPDKERWFFPWPLVGKDGFIVVGENAMWIDKTSYGEDVISASEFIREFK